MARHRVLVVDDQSDFVSAVCCLLGVLGHECAGLTRGAAVLEAVASFQPTIVLLDIGLPDMSGYKIARAIRRHAHAAHRLVAISGWGSADDQARAIRAGFDEHVVKPIDLTVLQAVLARASAAPA